MNNSHMFNKLNTDDLEKIKRIRNLKLENHMLQNKINQNEEEIMRLEK